MSSACKKHTTGLGCAARSHAFLSRGIMSFRICTIRRIVTGLSICGHAGTGSSQDLRQRAPIVDVDAKPCSGCTVAVQRTFAITGVNSRIMGHPRLTVRDSRGRLYVVNERVSEPPDVYDSTGAFIGPLGGKGNGPGEVTPTSFVEIGRGDTIRVHSHGRISVFDPSLAFRRSFVQITPESSPWDMVSIPGGKSASTSRAVAERPEMSPISVRDSKGLLIRTIELTDNKGIQPIRRLAVAHNQRKASLWVSETHQLRIGYRIMLMDTLGTVHSTLRREPEWWYARQAITRVTFGSVDTMSKPVTSVTSIREGSHGRLLVLMSHPRREWKGVRRVDRYNGHYEARLDVIDIASRRLVGSVMVPGAALQVLSDDRFATYREDADGIPWLEVWRISVKP